MMTDSFTEEDQAPFSFDQLREDERELDKQASLVDTRTDIDYREASTLIWRCLLLLRYYWHRFAVVLSMEWVMTAVGTAVAPWAGKVLVDHVVLGLPIPDDGKGYPTFLLPVIDFLVGSSAITILLWLSLWTVIGVSARVIFGYVHDLLEARMQHSLLHMARSRLFESMRRLSMTQLDNQPIGDSVFRTMHDVKALPDVIRMVLQVTTWGLVTFSVAAFTMLSAYPDSPLVVWLAVGAMPVFVMVTFPFARMIRRRTQANVAAGTVFVSVTEEGMDNIQAVQSLGVNQIEKERFGLKSANAFRRERFLALAIHVVSKLGDTAGKFLYWGFMLHMLGLVISGEMTPGDYAVVLGYFMAMSKPAHSIGGLWVALQEPIARARRVFSMLDMEDEKELGHEVLAAVEDGVTFHEAGFEYPDGRRALKNVSFEAKVGEIVALAGSTGAGKTTLAYLIPRYHRASEGQVRIDGKDVNALSIDSLRNQITYVFQETETLPESIADNIRFGKPDARMDEVKRVARLVGIDDFISELADGYDTLLGTTSSKLSVGQKQRVSIARGLLRDTPILILDEPTSALDPETESYLMAALEEAAKEKLVIIIAHRLSTIRRSNRILFLEDGEIREQGSHEQLMAIPEGTYRTFLELQN